MKRFSIILSLLAALAIILSACSPSGAASNKAVQITDSEGKEFKLDQPAQRIISLAASITETLFAISAGPQVVAREDFSNFPEEVEKLPSMGGYTGAYNLEQIAQLEPDLILVSPLTSPDAIKSLQDITKNVLVIPNPVTLDELYTNIVNIGILTGHQKEAETLVTDLKARVQAVEKKLANVTEKPKVFYELDATDPTKPWTSGPGTFIDLLIGMAGGQNIGSVLTSDWAQISQEELIIQDPDIILLGDSLYGGITPESVAARPGWEVMTAVKNQRVFEFYDDLVTRPGPRLVDGLEALAKDIHPELFK